MRPTASRTAARKSLARARRSGVGRGAPSPAKVRRAVGTSRPASRTAVTRPARTAITSRPASRTGASSRVTSKKEPVAKAEPPPEPTSTPTDDLQAANEIGSRVRLTAEGKLIVKGVKKYDMKERMKVLEIVLAEKIIETRNTNRALAALTTALESVKTEKNHAVEETKELSEYKVVKEQECANWEERCQGANRELRRLKNDLDSTQEHLDTTNKRLKKVQLEKEEIQADFDSSNKKISNQKVKIEALADRNKVLDNEIEECRLQIVTMEKKIEVGDDERRNLHEVIQQLKGNIRVFARIRPLLPKELAENHTSDHITFNTDNGLELEREEKKEKTEFEFDKVFQPSSTQAQVFEEVQQLVRSSLDGYNVCIFAYGQTGSGKTFSMEGPENAYDDEEFIGIIPRSFEFLINTIEKSKEKGWSFELEASYLEVYCEELRDLLVPADINKKLKIEGAGTKHINVQNMSRHKVTSQQQILNLVKRANKRRATASTNVNERSSRSHSGVCNIYSFT